MLKVSGLTKEFGGVRAVDNCTLAVARGRITGLIGPNGAGKTTLFDLISGVTKPDSGEILLDDHKITGMAPHDIFASGLMRTFQVSRELCRMTLVENLMLMPIGQDGERLFGCFWAPKKVREQERWARGRAHEVLEYLELISLKGRYAGELSGGQKKLLDIGRALMSDHKIMLFDEPGAGVNPTLLNRISDHIRALNNMGKTILLIEHDMDLVTRLCDQVIVMAEGRVLASGSFAEISTNQEVLSAYLGAE